MITGQEFEPQGARRMASTIIINGLPYTVGNDGSLTVQVGQTRVNTSEGTATRNGETVSPVASYPGKFSGYQPTPRPGEDPNKSFFENLWDGLPEVPRRMWNALWSDANDAVNEIGKKVGGLADSAVDGLSGEWNIPSWVKYVAIFAGVAYLAFIATNALRVFEDLRDE